MLVVPVQSGTTLVAGRGQVLFDVTVMEAGGARPYDVTPDGRFVVIRSGATEAGGDAPSNLVLVQHWTEELKRLVPTN